MRRSAFRIVALVVVLFGNATPTPTPPALHPGRPYDYEAWIAVIPDVQNYCSSANGITNPTAADNAEGVRQLQILAADVIAMRPAFVIQLGDIGDQASTSGDDATDLDNFTTNTARYNESVCIKTNLFDPLDAAGIPWIAMTGNHDTYRDYERVFPRQAFLAKSYAYAAQNEVDRYHAGFNDTEQRAALFTTEIGPICVVAGDYINNGALDQTFMNANIGCGGTTPTIMATHNGVSAAGASPPLAAAGNSEVFLSARGHITPTVPGPLQTAVDTASPGGFRYIDLFTNSQEASLDCGAGTNHDGRSVHTGIGEYTVVRIIPNLNIIAVQRRSALRGGDGARFSSCNVQYDNAVISFATPLCTRFPAMKGC